MATICRTGVLTMSVTKMAELAGGLIRNTWTDPSGKTLCDAWKNLNNTTLTYTMP